MPEAPTAKITPAQMKRLQTLMGKLAFKDGVPKPAQRPWRLIWVGRRVRPENPYLYSFKELTKAEAAAALELLATEIPGQPRSRRRSGPEAGRAGRKKDRGAAALVSGASLDLLARLKNALGWNQERLEAFARRQLRGRFAIRTEADANKIIWGLKRILRAQKKDSEANGASPIKQTPTSDPAAESSAGAELSACSGCADPLEGEPNRKLGDEEDSAVAQGARRGPEDFNNRAHDF